MEFKESTGQLDRSMETLCAFLNSEGGTILYGVKDKTYFLDKYLYPAIEEGYVEQLYPNSPKHPKQKYMLTEKGKALLK